MELKMLALALLLLVHGGEAKASPTKGAKNACHTGDADNVAVQLDQFNKLLGVYASLGGNALAASVVPSNPPVRAPQVTGAQTSYLGQAKPHLTGEPNRHVGARAVEVPQHGNAHLQPSSIQLYAVRSSANPAKPADSVRHAYQQRIQETWNQLRQQQVVLNKMQDTCIPGTHKLKVANSVQKVLGTYVLQEKNLKAAGKLVQEPAKKAKKGRKIKRAERNLRAQVAEATNGGSANGAAQDDTQYTQMTVVTTSTAALDDTVSVSADLKDKGTSMASGNASTASSDSPDNSSASESESEDETTTDAGGAAAPTATHSDNIITSIFDGTLHLITGSVHFFEHLLGDVFMEGTDEVARLVGEVERIYHSL